MVMKKNRVIFIISLLLILIVGIFSYSLFRKEISTQQVKGSMASIANSDTTTEEYTLTFINRSMKIEISASSSDTVESKLEEAEQEFNKKFSNPFVSYRENGYKYVFSTNSNITNRWSLKEDVWYPCTSANVPSSLTFYAMYDKTAISEKYTYKIELNQNGGEGGITGLYIVRDGDTKKIYTDSSCNDEYELVGNHIEIPTRKGYEFNGYTGSIIDANGNIEALDYLLYGHPSSDEILYAQWDIKEYNITYNGIEDCMYSPNPSVYTVETDTITLNNPTKANYTFIGWTGSNGETPQTTVTIEKGSTGDKIYTANWEAKKYRIVLNKNDGTDSKDYLYVKYGDGIYRDENYEQKYELNGVGITIDDKIPTRDGYTFDGFAEDREGNGLQINSAGETASGTYFSLINKNTTEDYNLYAKWKVNPPEIVEVDGNPETWTNQDVTLLVVVNRNQQLADMPYSFDGGVTWQFENEKTYTENTSGIEIRVKDPYGNIGTYPTINIDKIDKNPPIFTVIPSENGIYRIVTGDLDGSGVASCTLDGVQVALDENGAYDFKPEKSGTYTIKVTDNAGNSVEDTLKVVLPSDDKVAVTGVTLDKNTLELNINETGKLTATITPNNATDKSVTFSSSDTSVAKVSTDGTVTALKAGTAVITVITKDGNKTATCNVTVKDNTQPEKKVYTVKFDSNGGTGTMSNQEFTMDKSQNLTANTFTRKGYTFSGWNTKADGTGTSYKNSESVTNLTTINNGTVTLYAQWTGNKVAYKVEHYKEQEDKTYKIEETEEITGTVGETVKAKEKTYEGYTYNSSESQSSGIVQADGSLVLKMYYSLNKTVSTFVVKYYKDDGAGNYTEVKEDEKEETGTIGQVVTAEVKPYDGYMYNKDKSKESISGKVKEDGSLVLGVYYRKLKAPYIEITVKDPTTQKVKEGVKVTLYDSEGKEIGTEITDIIGKVAFENLEKGKTYKYKIEGDSKEYKFRVTEEGKIEYINDDDKTDDNPTDEDPKDDTTKDDTTKDDKGNNSNTSNSQTNGQTDNTKASSVIPKAGIKGKLMIMVVVLLTGAIGVFYIKYKKLNKIC